MNAYRPPPLAGRSPQADDEDVPPLAGGSLVQGLQATATNANQGQFGNPKPQEQDGPQAWENAPTAVRALGAGGEALAHGQLAAPAAIANRREQSEAEDAARQAHMGREIARQEAAMEEWRRQQGLVVGVPRVG